MDIALISRFFDTRNEGSGNHSKLVYEGLRDYTDLNILKVSEDDSIFPSNNKITYTIYIKELKYILKRKKFNNVDIFHAINPVESLYVNKKKAVINILDFIPITMPLFGKSFGSSLYVHIFDKAIREAVKCENLIANNEDVKQDLITYYEIEEDNVEVIPPPISGDLYPKDIKHDKFTIGTLSRLDARKRVDILVKSFIEADIDDSELLIGGRGPELDYLKQLAKNDDRVKFLGFIPDEKVNDFYNSLDLFVFPTVAEGYGMPIIEAMACKKPVITLKDSRIPSNVKNKTCVVDRNNLASVLRNHDFKCDIKRNLEFYKEHSLKNIAEKNLKVYNRIV